MSCLLAECIDSLREAKLWFIDGKGEITGTGYYSFLIGHDAFWAILSGKKVALRSNDQLCLMALLVGLDGLCSELLLIPDECLEDSVNQFLKMFQADYFLEFINGEILVSCNGKIENVNFNLELLWSNSIEISRKVCLSQVAKRDKETWWVVSTSGTSGMPKLVKHNLRTLCRTINKKNTESQKYRWGLLYSITRFAGLQVFLQSFLTKSILIITNQNDSLDIRIMGLLKGGCNALSATPTMWRKILMSSYCDQFEFKQITLGGEIADQQVLSALSKKFPYARIIHIYASTEAGVGFSVTDVKAGFPINFTENSPDSTGIRVDPSGRLMLHPLYIDQIYVGGEFVIRDDGWVDTGDLVQKIGDRYFFLGRANGCINVGGNKVHPEEVEQVLRSYSGVLDARVWGLKNAFTGFLVAADIILAKEFLSASEIEKAVIAHCRIRLMPYKVPSIIRVVQSLSVSTAGKVERG